MKECWPGVPVEFPPVRTQLPNGQYSERPMDTFCVSLRDPAVLKRVGGGACDCYQKKLAELGVAKLDAEVRRRNNVGSA